MKYKNILLGIILLALLPIISSFALAGGNYTFVNPIAGDNITGVTFYFNVTNATLAPQNNVTNKSLYYSSDGGVTWTIFKSVANATAVTDGNFTFPIDTTSIPDGTYTLNITTFNKTTGVQASYCGGAKSGDGEGGAPGCDSQTVATIRVDNTNPISTIKILTLGAEKGRSIYVDSSLSTDGQIIIARNFSLRAPDGTAAESNGTSTTHTFIGLDLKMIGLYNLTLTVWDEVNQSHASEKTIKVSTDGEEVTIIKEKKVSIKETAGENLKLMFFLLGGLIVIIIIITLIIFAQRK